MELVFENKRSMLVRAASVLTDWCHRGLLAQSEIEHRPNESQNQNDDTELEVIHVFLHFACPAGRDVTGERFLKPIAALSQFFAVSSTSAV